MTTNDAAETTDGTDAGQTDTSEVSTTTAAGTAELDADDDQDDDQDDDELADGDEQDAQGGRRRNREARYRTERNELRTERDALRAQLDAIHQDVVSEVASAAGLRDAALLRAAGYELAGFLTEDGKVDRAKVTEASVAAMDRFGIPRSRLLPSLQQGQHGTPSGGKHVADVLNDALGR